MVLVVVEVAGFAQVGEVRDVGVPAIFEVVDVVGVAVLGVGGTCDAAAVAYGQDDPLRFGCTAHSTQGELAPVAVEDGRKDLGVGGELSKLIR